jgi:hypothetical protein
MDAIGQVDIERIRNALVNEELNPGIRWPRLEALSKDCEARAELRQWKDELAND